MKWFRKMRNEEHPKPIVEAGADDLRPNDPDQKRRSILHDADGRELEAGDLSDFTGTVGWKVVDPGAEQISPRAEELLALGQQAGRAGNSQEALGLFAEAHREAPQWPYPLYETAFTYLLQGDLEEAERQYTLVETLAPRGFFTSQSELDCVRRERAGEFAPGTSRFFVAIADMPSSNKKRALLEKILEASPTFAPAWYKLAQVLEQDDAKLSAIESGLSCRPDPQTRGWLLINRAIVINRMGDHDQALGLLKQLISQTDVPEDIELNARMSLRVLLAQKDSSA